MKLTSWICIWIKSSAFLWEENLFYSLSNMLLTIKSYVKAAGDWRSIKRQVCWDVRFINILLEKQPHLFFRRHSQEILKNPDSPLYYFNNLIVRMYLFTYFTLSLLIKRKFNINYSLWVRYLFYCLYLCFQIILPTLLWSRYILFLLCRWGIYSWEVK